MGLPLAGRIAQGTEASTPALELGDLLRVPQPPKSGTSPTTSPFAKLGGSSRPITSGPRGPLASPGDVGAVPQGSVSPSVSFGSRGHSSSGSPSRPDGGTAGASDLPICPDAEGSKVWHLAPFSMSAIVALEGKTCVTEILCSENKLENVIVL